MDFSANKIVKKYYFTNQQNHQLLLMVFLGKLKMNKVLNNNLQYFQKCDNKSFQKHIFAI